MKTTALSIILLALLFAVPVQATVLTFECPALNQYTLPQDYGDRVTAATMGTYSYGTDGGFTPNVVVQYDSDVGNQSGIYIWPTSYASLTKVLDNSNAGATKLIITFMADTGYLVSLNSFDYAAFSNYGPQYFSATVTDGANNVLYSPSTLTAMSDHSKTLLFGPGVSANQLILTIEIGSGSTMDYVGLDNIQFSQSQVPLPGAVWLLGSGLLGLVGLRRFRKS